MNSAYTVQFPREVDLLHGTRYDYFMSWEIFFQ